jgi:formamidopyrimidine-DNA glycosylase
MPEGPEVRCIADQLQHLKHNKITGFSHCDEKKVFCDEEILFPLLIKDVFSYGKKIVIVTDKTNIFFSLGMTGRILFTETLPKHTRLILNIENYNLIFQDTRGFGKIVIQNNFDILAKLGFDCLQAAIDDNLTGFSLWYAYNNHTNLKIVEALLKQECVAGIGNYIRSEALRLACINPFIVVKMLTKDQWNILADALKTVLLESYNSGGLTIQDYISPDGTRGSYQCRIYHREVDHENQKVEKTQLSGRTIFYTPTVQLI